MTMKLPTDRARDVNEVRHGQFLASRDPERIWGWSTPAGRLRAQRRAELIIAAASLRPGLNVLEIGCGTGLFTELFSQSGCHILSVDISPDLLSIARKRNISPQLVTFREEPFESLQDPESFDAIIGSSILHHLEIFPALDKIFTLLKPGGRMAFTEPNLLNPQVYLERRFAHWRIFAYTSPDETAFRKKSLAHSLRKTGFMDIKITPFDWLHPSTPKPLIPLVTYIGPGLESMPLLREFSGSLLISASKP